MYLTPIAPTDFSGNFDNKILQKAELVCIESAKLLANYSPILINEIKELLRITNSYYSNRIESEGTHPINIEKAMKKEYSKDSKEKAKQNLSLAHIESQKYLEKKDINPFNESFVKLAHKQFYSYDGMEQFLKIKEKDKTIIMVAGDFRENDVEVGKHIAITHQNLYKAYDEYERLYKIATKFGTKTKKLIYILSSHHRLAWLHPFLDGNGRTSRLVLDSLFNYIGIEGYGLWNISRGLARRNKDYKDYLALADSPRTGDSDGRGELSKDQLLQFVNFMLDICLDQIKYMSEQLKIPTLDHRIETFVQTASKSMYNIEPLPKHTDKLLRALLIKGEVKRADVANIIGTKDRTASSLVKTLIQREYIRSDTPRGKIRIKFNTYFAMKIFPELMPEI